MDACAASLRPGAIFALRSAASLATQLAAAGGRSCRTILRPAGRSSASRPRSPYQDRPSPRGLAHDGVDRHQRPCTLEQDEAPLETDDRGSRQYGRAGRVGDEVAVAGLLEATEQSA